MIDPTHTARGTRREGRGARDEHGDEHEHEHGDEGRARVTSDEGLGIPATNKPQPTAPLAEQGSSTRIELEIA
jgi:hypothetical protein